jgi:long-chain acyl-CoA synthetase
MSELIYAKAQQYGPKLALCQRGGDPAEHYTYSQLDKASGRLAGGFASMGIRPGDRVAILCDSRPRWGVVFFAALRCGAVVVPLDTRQGVAELGATLADARPRLLLVSSQHEAAATWLAGEQADLAVLSIEPAGEATGFPSMDTVGTTDIPDCADMRAGDPAVLTYTSGTMGTSKGVVTTYGNLLFQIRAFAKVLHNDSHCRTVSILPLSHLFELTAGFLGLLYGGGRACYCSSLLPHEILTAMREQQVTCMVTVPLFLKLLADSIRREIGRQPAIRRALFRILQRLSPLLPMRSRRHVFAALHRQFGGRLEYFICGGAPLDIATLTFFENLGLPVYQGYGLAETSPVIATNGPQGNRRGSVGKALPDVEICIAPNGEILTRGPHVMHGYFGNEELTKCIIDNEGWLHTGDLGYLDADGFLFISGREKNAIVLGSGKKVQPEELEAVLFEHPDIAEGCVVGVKGRSGLMIGSEEICAVAVASEEAMTRCGEQHEDPALLIRRVIEQRSRDIAPGMRPTRIVLRTEPLPRTTTRKVRRHDIRDWLNAEATRA